MTDQVADKTPDEIFQDLKSRKQHITDEALSRLYDSAMYLAGKYMATGQIQALRKLYFVVKCIDKERELINLGIDTFVYQSDIDFYIDTVGKTTPVKIIELENYTREIPDDIVEVIGKTKHLFNKMYVVFTDYTGREEKRIEAEKRSKDPILFGVFIDEKERVCVERFYFLGDWVDEYCSLTLDRMLGFVKTYRGHENPSHSISTPSSIEELKDYLEAHKNDKGFTFTTAPVSRTTLETSDNLFYEPSKPNTSESKSPSYWQQIVDFFKA